MPSSIGDHTTARPSRFDIHVCTRDQERWSFYLSVEQGQIYHRACGSIREDHSTPVENQMKITWNLLPRSWRWIFQLLMIYRSHIFLKDPHSWVWAWWPHPVPNAPFPTTSPRIFIFFRVLVGMPQHPGTVHQLPSQISQSYGRLNLGRPLRFKNTLLIGYEYPVRKAETQFSVRLVQPGS